METLMVYLYDSFAMFTADQEWDHADRIAQTRLCEALRRQHQGRNYCLHEWMKAVLHTPYGEWFHYGPQSGWITTEMHFQYACVCYIYEWMLSGEQEWKSEREWKLDLHIWMESIIDKRRLFVVVSKDNGLTDSTYKSNGIRACVKQTEWRATVTNPRHILLTTVCPPFCLPPCPGSKQLKHFSHDN